MKGRPECYASHVIKANPDPPPTIAGGESWWLGTDRDTFQRRLQQEVQRMTKSRFGQALRSRHGADKGDGD